MHPKPAIQRPSFHKARRWPQRNCRNVTRTTTAAAVETDTAESPGNRPVRPEDLPVAGATGGGVPGRSVDFLSAPAGGPERGKPPEPRVRPGMAQWSDRTDHQTEARCWHRKQRAAVAKQPEKSRCFIRTFFMPDGKKKSTGILKQTARKRGIFSLANRCQPQTQKAFGNRQSQARKCAACARDSRRKRIEAIVANWKCPNNRGHCRRATEVKRILSPYVVIGRLAAPSAARPVAVVARRRAVARSPAAPVRTSPSRCALPSRF